MGTDADIIISYQGMCFVAHQRCDGYPGGIWFHPEEIDVEKLKNEFKKLQAKLGPWQGLRVTYEEGMTFSPELKAHLSTLYANDIAECCDENGPRDDWIEELLSDKTWSLLRGVWDIAFPHDRPDDDHEFVGPASEYVPCAIYTYTYDLYNNKFTIDNSHSWNIDELPQNWRNCEDFSESEYDSEEIDDNEIIDQENDLVCEECGFLRGCNPCELIPYKQWKCAPAENESDDVEALNQY